MASDRQIAANRANSLKSTGPVSPAGKQKSSRNSTRHGMLARTIVLDGESRDRFSTLLFSLENEFLPQTGVEHSLVENMAVARWRQMRLWGMERAGLTYEIQQQESIPDNQDILRRDACTRTVLAFRSLVDHSRSLDLINRYESRYDRQYHRALESLLELREKRDFAKRTQSAGPQELTIMDKPDV